MQIQPLKKVRIIGFKAIWRYKWFIFLLSCVFSATFYYQMLKKPDEWRATAAIQIGKLVLAGNPELIESQGTIINRLAQPLIRREIIQTVPKQYLNYQIDIDAVRRLFQKSFISRIVRDADVVDLEVKSYSPNLSHYLLSKSTQVIVDAHLDSQNQLIQQIEKENQYLREEYQKLGLQIEELQQILKKQGQQHTQQYVLFLVIKNLSETRGQIESKIQTNLRSVFIMRQYSTHLMEGIVLSDGPIGPRRKLLTAAVFFISILGLMLLCIFFELRHMLRAWLRLLRMQSS